MYQDKVILCGSNKYEQKYYLNEDFNGLPEEIKKELKIMCVIFTEEVGGILTLEFDDIGNLSMITIAQENDLLYDEIGSVLMIKRFREEKKELLEILVMYFKVFFLGEEISE